MLQSEMLQLVAEVQAHLSSDYSFLTEWSVGYDYAKKRAGLCKFNSKQVIISLEHIKLNPRETVQDTLLHEFAHAIAYELYNDAGHGTHWKAIAQKIGASPQSRGNYKLPDSPWQVVVYCEDTQSIEKVASRHRRNKKIKNYSIQGRPDTYGRLYYVSTNEYEQYQSGLLSIAELTLHQ